MRLQELQLYCSWLHELQVDETLGENKNKKKATAVNNEMDETLFQLLANALPETLLFLRVGAESTVADGKRFAKLKTAIDSLASASREQPTSAAPSKGQEALQASLALHKIGSGRLSRDPDSKATHEEVTETSKKKSRITFKKDKNKKQREDRGEASDEADEAEMPAPMALSAAESNAPGPSGFSLEELCETVFAMTAAKAAGVCYAFQNKGKCDNKTCPYVHEARTGPPPQKLDHPTSKFKARPQKGDRPPRKMRSPPPKREPSPQKQRPRTPPRKRSRSPPKRGRSPERRRSRERRSPQRGRTRHDHRDNRSHSGSYKRQNFGSSSRGVRRECREMHERSHCANTQCTDAHGTWIRDKVACENYTQGIPCPHLWTSAGCLYSHTPKNE
jgi:hypothetical protein